MDLWKDLKKRSIDGINDLVVVIVQDAESKEVLMQAFANQEAVEKTIETKKAHYYSTSRKKLWLKGETSGHYQQIKDVLVDCDADALVYLVDQAGAACHTGYRTCFFRKVEKDGLKTVGEKVA